MLIFINFAPIIFSNLKIVNKMTVVQNPSIKTIKNDQGCSKSLHQNHQKWTRVFKILVSNHQKLSRVFKNKTSINDEECKKSLHQNQQKWWRGLKILHPHYQKWWRVFKTLASKPSKMMKGIQNPCFKTIKNDEMFIHP